MSRRSNIRDREHGGALPIILGVLLVLAAAFFGATTIGRVAIAKGEAQRAADAACLTMANIVKHEGLQVIAEQQTRAEQLGRRNTRLPISFEWTRQETLTAVDFTCRAVASVPAPTFIWSAGSLTVSATAKSRAGQQTLGEAQKKYPQLVIVLDYSGSMERDFGGQWTRNEGGDGDFTDDSINDLKNAVMTLLNKDYDFRYGLVIFGTGVVDKTDKVALGTVQTLKDKVQGQQVCPYGTGSPYPCSTASAIGLSAAYDLLNDNTLPTDEKKYVIFVSDGEPTHPTNDPQGEARKQADRLWNDLKATIYTLHIMNRGSSTDNPLKQFMVSISGKPADHPKEAGYYFAANDPAKLDRFFTELGAGLACQLGPINLPAGTDPNKMHVFVRDGGRDIALKNSRTADDVPPMDDGVVPADQEGDLWSSLEPFHDGDWFFYIPEEKLLFVTPGVCERVQSLNQDLIIRVASPQLTQ